MQALSPLASIILDISLLVSIPCEVNAYECLLFSCERDFLAKWFARGQVLPKPE
jgi:hypothetical protein